MRAHITSFCVIVNDAGRLDKFLAHELSEISRSKVKALIESGAVCVDSGVVRDPAFSLKKRRGVQIEIDYDLAAVLASRNTAPSADPAVNFGILYEDSDVLVVNKPAGIVVHPGAGNYEHTLVNGLMCHCALSSGSDGSRPGIVHRIDKDTSGILVIAKNDRSHAGLAEQFSVHSIKRCYVCFCFGVPRIKTGKIETKIVRAPKNRLKMAVSKDETGKIAITSYKVLREFGSFASKIECELRTGRTHQIRVHMSHLGHSLVGDKTYRTKTIYPAPKNLLKYLNEFPRQALHAYFLEFVHPTTGKKMRFEVEMPEDLKELEGRVEENL